MVPLRLLGEGVVIRWTSALVSIFCWSYSGEPGVGGRESGGVVSDTAAAAAAAVAATTCSFGPDVSMATATGKGAGCEGRETDSAAISSSESLSIIARDLGLLFLVLRDLRPLVRKENTLD